MEIVSSKQHKKLQAKIEPKLKAGDFVNAYWTYSDYLENVKTFSAKAEVCDVEKDSFRVRLIEAMKDSKGIELYAKDYFIYIPKTTNPAWSIHNRLEKIKK